MSASKMAGPSPGSLRSPPSPAKGRGLGSIPRCDVDDLKIFAPANSPPQRHRDTEHTVSFQSRRLGLSVVKGMILITSAARSGNLAPEAA